MDNKSQKERLEQELRFLKESFEAEVISKEEFEKGKDRIEKKLKEFGSSEGSLGVMQEEKAQEKKPEEDKQASEEKINLKVIDENDIDYDIQSSDAQKKKEPEIKQEDNKTFKYTVVFVVLALVIFFAYSLLKPENKPQLQEKNGSAEQGTTIIAQPENVPATNVIVLNGRNECFNCDPKRILDIIENWFGQLNVREVDYNTEEGRNLLQKTNAEILPVYILDENITFKPNFEKFKQAFVQRGSYYLLNENAAASTFYFKREEIQNRLDFFSIAGDAASIKAEKNLQEFLDNFKNIKFEKHFANNFLTQELGIKTFPAFLVNNRIKFSGIQSAETIKGNYCILSKLEECKKNLSKNLI